MGCWYETCNVSHLPIVTGDEIVIIPLLKRNHPHELGFYVDDLYVPLSLPIYGKYDDDFRFVDCTTCKKAEEYLLSLEFKDKDTVKNLKDIKDFCKLLNSRNKITVGGDYNPEELTYFICHKKLFDDCRCAHS